MLISRDLRVFYANEVVAKMLFGEETQASDITGRSVSELYPPEAYAERVEMADTIAESGKPMLSRTIWNGQQMYTWIYPVAMGQESDNTFRIDQFIAVVRPDIKDFETLAKSTPHANVYQTKYVDFGPASRLTHTELIILALIGQNMTIAEIAKQVERSTKTVESHRLAIGRKLDFQNRGQLVQFVQQLGLKVSDVYRKDLKRANQPYYKQSPKKS